MAFHLDGFVFIKSDYHLIISMALSFEGKYNWDSGLCIIFSCQCAKPEIEVSSRAYSHN